MSGKGHQVNNDSTGPSPASVMAAAAAVATGTVQAGTEVLASADAHAPAADKPRHQEYVRAPEKDGHGAQGHKLPYDDHHGNGGAFVVIAGQRVPVRVRIDPKTKKATGWFVEVDGKEIETDRDGAPIATK
jgi:hypothetical protein